MFLYLNQYYKHRDPYSAHQSEWWRTSSCIDPPMQLTTAQGALIDTAPHNVLNTLLVPNDTLGKCVCVGGGREVSDEYRSLLHLFMDHLQTIQSPAGESWQTSFVSVAKWTSSFANWRKTSPSTYFDDVGFYHYTAHAVVLTKILRCGSNSTTAFGV